MVLTENIRMLAKQALYIILAHTILLTINIYSHAKIDILFSPGSNLFYSLFFCFVPLITVFLLATKFARQAAVVTIGILAAVLVYNIFTRFAAVSLFPVREAPLFWKILYEGSYGLLLISEVIGLWIVIKLLKEVHKQTDSQAGTKS
ncbi:MAG: hypothetical protein JXA06_11290 [Bacteroidetes bacterium]|nr:hypothetical protein [Bacteroidota bacterium]